MRRAALILAAVGLLAAGCTQADDEAGDAPTDATTEVAGELGQDRIIEGGAPVAGGSLTMAVEAETDGWDPTKNRWAASGTLIGLAIYDPLTAPDEQGIARPYLAESVEPDDDFTVWTITLRPDITFHDGSPVTADAVKATMDGHIASVLTRPAIAPILDDGVVVVDDRTVEVRMSSPWVAFPQVLSGQVGVVVSPTTLAAEDGTRDPIGSGPFDFVTWVPGNRLETERYDGYWRTHDGGQQLPYLDEVTFVAIPDGQTRINALGAGEVDVLHTFSPTEIVELEQRAADGEIQIRNARSAGEKGFVMLNLGRPPFDNESARRAVVLATDVDAYNTVINEGAVERARSVFPASSPYHNPEADAAWPDHDPDGARAAAAQYEAETGQPLTFTLSAPPTPIGLEGAQLLQAQWADVGIDVEIATLEQTAYILAGVQGSYEAILWRQFGAADPDTDAHWWLSENAADIDAIGLNFARIRDDQVDEDLRTGREDDDEAVRRAAYADLALRFNELMPYVWISNTRWVVAANDDVRDFWSGPLPDGRPSEPIVSGVFRLTHTWIER